MPKSVLSAFYNDRFDDFFGSIYATTCDGFNYKEMCQYAERLCRLILQLPYVNKVELIDEQPEKFYIEIERDKIPLVLAGTFCTMHLLSVDLHKVSLGVLIIALGLLVDDEIMAVEMISVKFEEVSIVSMRLVMLSMQLLNLC